MEAGTKSVQFSKVVPQSGQMSMGVSQIFFRADVNEIVSSLPQFAGTYYFKEGLDPLLWLLALV